jgi:hypothetical protein
MRDDKYPSDPMQDLRDLQITLADSQAVGRPALTEASAGWIMRHRSLPSSPGGSDIHIVANGSRLWVVSSLGSVAVVDKTGVADVATANADATYGTPERDLINELKTQLNALLASLRAAGIILT